MIARAASEAVVDTPVMAQRQSHENQNVQKDHGDFPVAIH